MIEVLGVDDVLRDYAKGKKALQSKMGLVTKEAAEMLKRKIQETLEMMVPPAVDTGLLWNAIAAIKIASYTYNVGDLDYPMGVQPYGIFVEKGVSYPHFVPREYFFITGKEGSKPQMRILELDSIRESRGRLPTPGLVVGPMEARPYHSTAVENSRQEIEQFFKDKIEPLLFEFEGIIKD